MRDEWRMESQLHFLISLRHHLFSSDDENGVWRSSMMPKCQNRDKWSVCHRTNYEWLSFIHFLDFSPFPSPVSITWDLRPETWCWSGFRFPVMYHWFFVCALAIHSCVQSLTFVKFIMQKKLKVKTKTINSFLPSLWIF